MGIPAPFGQPGYSATTVRYSRMVAAYQDLCFTGGLLCPVGAHCTYELRDSVALGDGRPGQAGFLWSQFYEGTSSTFPRKPGTLNYHACDNDAAWGGEMRLANVTMSGFTGAGAAAVVGGRFPDSSAPLFVAAANMAGSRPLYIAEPNPGWRVDDDCGNFTDCTGPRLVLAHDRDGSWLGRADAQAVARSPAHAARRSGCALNADWNAYVCVGTQMRMLYFESLDPDRLSRRLWPVTFADTGGAAVAAGFMDHMWAGGWTSLLRLNRYAAPVDGANVSITTTGTMPRRARLQLPGGVYNSTAVGAATVVTIPYVRPEVPDVTVGAAAGTRLFWNPPSVDDAHGTWYWHNPTRSLLVTVHPGAPAVVLTLTNLVMISIMISITDAAFWTSSTEEFLNDVTYSLGLDATKLVVVGWDQTPSRRALTAPMRGLWLAWLAPDADAGTLARNKAEAQQFFLATLGTPRFGNITVAALVDVYISGPLCDLTAGADGSCTCPDTGATIVVGNGTCLLPSAPQPPPPPRRLPPGMPVAVAITLSAVGLGVATGALVALPLAAYFFRRAALRRHTAAAGQVPPPLTQGQIRERLGGSAGTTHVGIRVWLDKQS